MRKHLAASFLAILLILFYAPLDVCISFDLERDPPAASEGKTSFRGIEEIPEVLKILEQHGTRGTFFVTGRVAERFPGQLKELDSLGHEIGVHGGFYHEEKLQGLSMDEQGKRISVTVGEIKDVTGKSPKGFRAPGHLYDENTILSLRDLGFIYDSSSVPSLGGWYLYGHPPYYPYRPYRLKGGVLEIPISPVLFDGNLDSLLAIQGESITKIELVWALLKSKLSRAPLVLYLHPGMMTDLENSPKNYRASRRRLEEFDRVLNFLDHFNVRYVTLEEVALEAKQ